MNKTLDSNDLVVNISVILSNIKSENRNRVFEDTISEMIESFYNFLNTEIEHPELDFITLSSTTVDNIDLTKLSNRKILLKLKEYLILYLNKIVQGFNRREALIPVINNYLLNLKCLLG